MYTFHMKFYSLLACVLLVLQTHSCKMSESHIKTLHFTCFFSSKHSCFHDFRSLFDADLFVLPRQTKHLFNTYYFPYKSGSAGCSFGLLPLFGKRTFGVAEKSFFTGKMPSCHSINSVKALNESQNIDSSQRNLPTGLVLVLSSN